MEERGTEEQRAMALRIARTFLCKLPPHVERREIETIALTGLWEALQRCPGANRPYLRKRIAGSILDELRRQDVVSRQLRRSIRSGECMVKRVDDSAAHGLSSDDNPEREFERKRDLQRLREAIRKTHLTPRQRSVLDRSLGGESFAAIAASDGTTEPNVWMLYRDAALRLRRWLRP